MNRHTLPALAAALVVVLSAVFLPPHLSGLSDRARLNQVHSEEVDSAEVSYVYRLTLEQRLSLLLHADDPVSSITRIEDASPSESELQETQVMVLAETLIQFLRDMNILSFESVEIMPADISFIRLVSQDNPSLYVSLWSVAVLYFPAPLGEPAAEAPYILQLLLDAETGVFYSFSLHTSAGGLSSLALEDELPVLIGDFTGLTLSEIALAESPADSEIFPVGPERLFRLLYFNADQEKLPMLMGYNDNTVFLSIT